MMATLWLPLLVIVLLLAVIWLVWAARRPLQIDLTRARKEGAAAAALGAELTHALELSNAAATLALRQGKEWERKAGEYRDAIEGILKERDTWNQLYDQQTIAHGNAQAIMMSVIGHLHQRLVRAGIEVTLPDAVHEVHVAFLENHVAPVLQRTGAAKGQLGPSPGQPLPEPGHSVDSTQKEAP